MRLLNGADFCAIAFPSAEELLKAFLAVSYGSGIDRFQAIKKDGEVVLPGFGKPVRQRRKDRTGVNPKTQQKIKIPAKTVVKFRVAKVAKDANDDNTIIVLGLNAEGFQDQ